MNIIEALQALKDGKKIRRDSWHRGAYLFVKVVDGDEIIYINDGNTFELEWVDSISISSTNWELYTSPIKLTAEERKALELAKACGYDLVWYDDCYLWAHVRGEDEARVADDDFPPLRALKGLFPRATNPTSIDSLLEGTI